MAAGLHFARAAEIGGVHRQPVERVGAGDELVVGEDGAEFERKSIERSAELLRGEDERRGERSLVPCLDTRGAGAQKCFCLERTRKDSTLSRGKVP